ncbi:YkoF family thiamine/hydroxymethylpyrimidine-binding protein [Pseudotenacibaculum haliotis]|uniref:YkoF family thiamine/hydroxymethylpyrimidine-binding protein n=1 Tax=Pseudotenacibaculum haliotis TaxID=1862138 RepID=A0ABW5LUC9_9FLAO
MKISVELTLMPLQNDFEEPIINFIKKLRASKFTVLENPLSTQIYGDYDELMPFLTEEIKSSFEQQEHVVLNLKMVKSDRSDYEPSF